LMIDEKISKCGIHVQMEYHSALKWKAIMTHTITQMNSENIKLHEKSHLQ
jgi:hypothetical protein